MKEFITDNMFSLAFWIWDLPGLAHEHWSVVEDDDDIAIVPDTWIGRIADRFAGWLYRTASWLTDDDDYNLDDGFYYFDEIDIVPMPTPAQIQLITMVSNDD